MWLYFALATALAEGIRATVAKHTLSGSDEYVVTWVQRLWAVPVVLVILAFTGIPALTTKFFIATISSVLVLTISGTLYMKALRMAPIYLTMPYLALTPLFMLVTSYFMVGEIPDLQGLFGIVFIVLGVYLLHLGPHHRKWWEPIAAIRKEKGSMYMLAVAFLFSIGSNLDKIAVMESTPVFYAISMTIAFSVIYAPIVLFKSKDAKSQMKNGWKWLLVLAGVQTLVILLQMQAVSTGLVTYVISLKRISILVAVILGWLFFKERELSQHIVAAGLMVTGAALIAL